MHRFARLGASGVLHHIMIRGIEPRKIFRNDKDRDAFLECLSRHWFSLIGTKTIEITAQYSSEQNRHKNINWAWF